jgi:uncharacterized protein YbjT (DUF2867 family)
VKAAISIDMAGYDVLRVRAFGIDAGAADFISTTRDTSVSIAQTIAKWAADAALQNQGFAAVVISEDFFVNQPGEEAPSPIRIAAASPTPVSMPPTSPASRAPLRAQQRSWLNEQDRP